MSQTRKRSGTIVPAGNAVGVAVNGIPADWPVQAGGGQTSNVNMDPDTRAAMIAAGLMEEAPAIVRIIREKGQAESCAPAQPLAQGEADPCFVEPHWWKWLNLAMVKRRGTMLFGPSGTGKTKAVHELGRRLCVNLFTFQAAKGCTIDDLIGVRDLKDGSSIFTPGPLTMALEQDGWLVIEEANAMPPAAFCKLNTLTDGSGDSLSLPDGRRLKAGPGFRAALLYNPNYAGLCDDNRALKDRLTTIYADYLAPENETRMLMLQMRLDESVAAGLVKYANQVRAARASIQFDLTPRSLMEMVECVRYGGTWQEAHEIAVLNKMGDVDLYKPQRDAVLNIAGMDLFNLPSEF